MNNAVSPCNRESVIAVMRQPGMDAEEPRQRILRNGKYVWTNSEKAIRERERLRNVNKRMRTRRKEWLLRESDARINLLPKRLRNMRRPMSPSGYGVNIVLWGGGKRTIIGGKGMDPKMLGKSVGITCT